MDFITIAPPVLALLNFSAAILITTGYVLVRSGDTRRHRYFMASALGVSSVFMVIYLYYHYLIGNVPFAGVGNIRILYFSILASHVILATFLFPMALTTAWFALSGRIARHRRIARWTLPIWLYVSVTGVIIYLMAFHIYPN